MGSLDDPKVRWLAAALGCSLVTLVVTTTLGIVAAVSALATVGTGEPLVVALVGAVAPYLAAGAVVGTVASLLVVALAVAVVRRLSLPRSRRLASAARLLERGSATAREAGLAERFEPTTDERIEELKRRYVDGDVGEAEFERRLARVVDEETAGRPAEARRLDREFER